MPLFDYLPHLLGFLETAKYPLLFIGSFLEGTVVMLTGGVLWRLAEVQFLPAYIALLVGDILADIMWYFIGYFGARPFVLRWGHVMGITPENLKKVERYFHKYHLRILIISKLTMGLGFAAAILTTAGMMRVSFARYLLINTVGGFIWVAAVMVVGYYFGNLFDYIPEDFQIAFIFVLIIAFFFVLRFLTVRLAKVEW